MRLTQTPESVRVRAIWTGSFLVAMPGMADDRFARAVIYVCAHSAEGAMGIVLNRPAADLNCPTCSSSSRSYRRSSASACRSRSGRCRC